MEEEEVPVASGSGQVRIEVRAGETSGDRSVSIFLCLVFASFLNH